MWSVIAVILVLGGLIFFHELGHFFFARLFGVGVKVFSLGFGPKLFGWKRGLTEYRLSALPLGGYVSMVGERPGEDLPPGFSPRHSFTGRPAWQRMIIIAAGPLANFVLAVAIIYGLILAQGVPTPVPLVAEVVAGSPAEAAGLKAGDRIVFLDGQEVTNSGWDYVIETIRGGGEVAHQLTILRGEERLSLSITPRITLEKNVFGEEIPVPLIGIRASVEPVAMDPASAFPAAVRSTYQLTAVIVTGLVKMIERIIPLDSVGGPIMIVQEIYKQSQEGLYQVLYLAAFISVNLGFLNILPIPVLDGGHILFCLVELITRRPLNERLQRIAIHIGLAALFLLMALAVFNDLRRLISTPS